MSGASLPCIMQITGATSAAQATASLRPTAGLASGTPWWPGADLARFDGSATQYISTIGPGGWCRGGTSVSQLTSRAAAISGFNALVYETDAGNVEIGDDINDALAVRALARSYGVPFIYVPAIVSILVNQFGSFALAPYAAGGTVAAAMAGTCDVLVLQTEGQIKDWSWFWLVVGNLIGPIKNANAGCKVFLEVQPNSALPWANAQYLYQALQPVVGMIDGLYFLSNDGDSTIVSSLLTLLRASF